MKIKIFAASLLIAGVSLSSMAQGYKDGIEYYKVGQLDNAKELLERNLNNASTDKAATYYYLGQIALKNGNTAEAKANYDKGVAANADYPYNYVGLGLLSLKNTGKPGDYFSTARKLGKKDPKVESAIARAYYDVNPTTYAKDIEKCIKDARKGKNMSDPESFIFEGDTYADQKEYGKAAGQYELAFTNDPDNTEATVKFANTYYFVNPTMALEKLEEFNAAHPNNALVQRQLAEKYYESNMGGKAAAKYGEYIKNPNHFNQDEVRYVQLLYFGNKYDESYSLASSLVNRLEANNPSRFYMQRMKLYNKVALKDYAGAVEDAEAFFAMSKPANATYEAKDYIDYAQALQEVNQPEKSAEAYVKAYELNPTNLDILRNLSDSYADAKDYTKAAYYYQMLYDGGNYTANDIYSLSKCYYNLAVTAQDDAVKNDAIAKARKYVGEANEKVSGNVLIVNQMARIEKLAEGDKAMGKASAAYNQLISILDAKEDNSGYDSYYVSAYNYLANAAMNQKDVATAKTYYRKWLEHDQSNEQLRQYVNSLK